MPQTLHAQIITHILYTLNSPWFRKIVGPDPHPLDITFVESMVATDQQKSTCYKNTLPTFMYIITREYERREPQIHATFVINDNGDYPKGSPFQ